MEEGLRRLKGLHGRPGKTILIDIFINILLFFLNVMGFINFKSILFKVFITFFVIGQSVCFSQWQMV